MREYGSVSIPQEAFIAALRMGKEQLRLRRKIPLGIAAIVHDAKDKHLVVLDPDKQVRMSFNVSWQRPAETCADAQFTRSVELSGSIQMDDGESVTVQGDGGLVAKFRLIRREIPAGDSGDAPMPSVIRVD